MSGAMLKKDGDSATAPQKYDDTEGHFSLVRQVS